MPREDSPYIVGEYWLDKRRDGKSPDVWQIARYDGKSRSVIYSSTRTGSIDDAKRLLDAHHARQVTRGPQEVDQAQLIPLMVTYWEEHGRTVERPDTIASSIRIVIGFLMQDEATASATVKDLGLAFQRRFVKWRTEPHSYEVIWAGKRYKRASQGVSGETIQRNIEDLRAAINHHVNMGRIATMPRLPSVPQDMRSEPRDLVLSWEQLGAMLGYAKLHSTQLYQFMTLMLASGVRPEAAAVFDPAQQWDAEFGYLDLQPVGKKRTKKRNPVVPAIDPFMPVLTGWEATTATKGHMAHRTAWNTMRRVLGLPSGVIGNTIRHTVATRLRADPECPRDMIDDLLGHDMAGSKTTRGYAKYDPAYMGPIRVALTKIYGKAMEHADQWLADHLLTKAKRGTKLAVVKRSHKA
jgi:integrase